MIYKLIAILVIITSFVGGFLLEGGTLISLWHPAELLIILGLGLGSFLAATPPHIWHKTMTYVGRYFANERVDRVLFSEALELMSELGRVSQRQGVIVLQNHLLNPETSKVFNSFPQVIKHETLLKFIIDNYSLITSRPPESFNFKSFLYAQVDDIFLAEMEVPKATGRVANLLPGFGIIAAVLGVILTMNLLGADMDIAKIGTSIGAALVGTLTGIFFSFAILIPFTHAIEIQIRQDRAVYEMVLSFFVAFQQGISPLLAEDIARQRIPAGFELE